jgi:hypothetical protein
MPRRLAISAVLALSTIAVGPAAASAQTSDSPTTPCIALVGAICPQQTFLGLVNGSAGGAVIRVSCVGPTRPWQMGQPVAGQSVAVTRRLPSTAATQVGFTGEASSIAAYLHFASPLASPFVPRVAVFRRYDFKQPIPTTLSVPCSGEGRAVFDPVDGGPKARASTVPVKFVSQRAATLTEKARPAGE